MLLEYITFFVLFDEFLEYITCGILWNIKIVLGVNFKCIVCSQQEAINSAKKKKKNEAISVGKVRGDMDGWMDGWTELVNSKLKAHTHDQARKIMCFDVFTVHIFPTRSSVKKKKKGSLPRYNAHYLCLSPLSFFTSRVEIHLTHHSNFVIHFPSLFIAHFLLISTLPTFTT